MSLTWTRYSHSYSTCVSVSSQSVTLFKQANHIPPMETRGHLPSCYYKACLPHPTGPPPPPASHPWVHPRWSGTMHVSSGQWLLSLCPYHLSTAQCCAFSHSHSLGRDSVPHQQGNMEVIKMTHFITDNKNEYISILIYSSFLFFHTHNVDVIATSHLQHKLCLNFENSKTSATVIK